MKLTHVIFTITKCFGPSYYFIYVGYLGKKRNILLRGRCALVEYYSILVDHQSQDTSQGKEQQEILELLVEKCGWKLVCSFLDTIMKAALGQYITYCQTSSKVLIKELPIRDESQLHVEVVLPSIVYHLPVLGSKFAPIVHWIVESGIDVEEFSRYYMRRVSTPFEGENSVELAHNYKNGEISYIKKGTGIPRTLFLF